MPDTKDPLDDTHGKRPGQRSGEGAQSVWEHLSRDTQSRAPSAPARSSGAEGSSARDLPAERASHTVLVVDDTEAARYALVRVVAAAGYRTVEAHNAADALRLAEDASAVVLDVFLPDELGIEVCRVLRARPKTANTPVIHVSSVFVEERHKREARSAGADDYFVAPVDSGRLVARLDELVLK